jgi:hypothetical protein
VSLDQAAEIARAEDASPGSARTLVQVAQDEGFQVLKDKARKVKLEAEQHRDLAVRKLTRLPPRGRCCAHSIRSWRRDTPSAPFKTPFESAVVIVPDSMLGENRGARTSR